MDQGMKKIAQVAIVCKDIEASRARWAELLGAEPQPIHTTRPGGEVKLVFRGAPSNARTKLTYLAAGDASIELLQPLGGGSSWQQYLDQHGEGVQHLGFQVDDLDGEIQRMERLGYPILHRGRYDSEDGDYVYFDTESKLGVTIELLHSDKK